MKTKRETEKNKLRATESNDVFACFHVLIHIRNK